MNAAHWKSVALDLAETVHEENFSSHRGVVELEGVDCFYVYSNHPYPDPSVRREEFARLYTWCETNGVKVLADETYGRYRDDEGYTRVVIVNADASQEDALRDAYEKIAHDITMGRVGVFAMMN